MAYTKNTWETGDIVSSQKLNHMEDGIANSENVFIVGGVTLGGEYELTGTLDKTWQQISDAIRSKVCMIIAENGDNAECVFIESVFDNPEPKEGDGRYQVSTAGGGYTFTTDSKDGYPATRGGLG